MGKINVYINENDYEGDKVPTLEQVKKLIDDFVDDEVTEIDIKYLKTELVE